MDAPRIEKFTFRRFLKNNPLLLYPMLIIFGIAIADIFIVEDPLLHNLLRMATWTAIGLQWIGLARNHEKQKIERLKSDGDMLKTYAELSIVTGESHIRFLVPYRGKFMSRIWNKLCKKTPLSLYEREGGDYPSFTKLYATRKEMFDMQLRGYINTNDGILGLKGIQYLTKGKQISDIL